ncbi:plasmid pRiA4b ORF-3 family protein [Pseudarthrobacter sp. NamB4]|uniref:plasmid pRiA4b ORF-3 family protein n=1 Tax=Pseudarthrobacter sp. NamB4 TaxID=2576837 RepID=UPI001F10FE07|nr:plasmid pRiA4b ORF-3 family protein [Pseudarthrobacter sp. NamB4]
MPELPKWLPAHDCEEPGDRPEEDCSLDQLPVLGAGEAFYEYDFGDSWLHRLELMSPRPVEPSVPPALLFDGVRRGPLEDSGGFPGYEEIMDALADASHPEHEECSAWVAEMTGTDEPFDPAFLDIPAVNLRQTWHRVGTRPEPEETCEEAGSGLDTAEVSVQVIPSARKPAIGRPFPATPGPRSRTEPDPPYPGVCNPAGSDAEREPVRKGLSANSQPGRRRKG